MGLSRGVRKKKWKKVITSGKKVGTVKVGTV